MIDFRAPDLRERLEILKVHTRTMPFATDVNLEDLAIGGDGMTGAELAAFCREAALEAIRERVAQADAGNPDLNVSMKHFVKVLEEGAWRMSVQ